MKQYFIIILLFNTFIFAKESILFYVDKDMRLFIDNHEVQGSDVRVVNLSNGEHNLMIIKPSQKTLSIGSKDYKEVLEPKKGKVIYRKSINISDDDIEFDFTSKKYSALLAITLETSGCYYTELGANIGNNHHISVKGGNQSGWPYKTKTFEVEPGKFNIEITGICKHYEKTGLFSLELVKDSRSGNINGNIKVGQEKYLTIKFDDDYNLEVK